MARLISLFALFLLAACHLDDLEELAVSHRYADRTSELNAQAIMAECEVEAAKLRASRRLRTVNSQSDQAYLNACFREISIMRAYGRR